MQVHKQEYKSLSNRTIQFCIHKDSTFITIDFLGYVHPYSQAMLCYDFIHRYDRLNMLCNNEI